MEIGKPERIWEVEPLQDPFELPQVQPLPEKAPEPARPPEREPESRAARGTLAELCCC